MTGEDTADTMIAALDEVNDAVNAVITMAKEKRSNATQVVYVDEDGDDATAVVYGYSTYVWKSGDSLDTLSSKLLGDPNLGTLLSYYNKINDEHSLKAGTTLKIPALSDTTVTDAIYAPSEKQDSYGVDLAVDDDGDLSVDAKGDAATIAGEKNLLQAIMLRLTSAMGKRIRLVSYGIRSSIGDNKALGSYLTSSIQETVKADPRIKDVEGLRFRGDGDKLFISLTYTDIEGKTGVAEAAI